MKKTMCIMGAALLIAGCSPKGAGSTARSSQEVVTTTVTTVSTTTSTNTTLSPAEPQDAAASAQESDGKLNEKAFATAARESNAFAFGLMQRVGRAEKGTANYCISPLSASWALSMAANGAQGETRKQLFGALGFGKSTVGSINLYQKQLIARLLTADSLTTLGIANSIWIREGLQVKAPFIATNKDYYDAQVREEPFNSTTLAQINDWCAQHTAGRITKILDSLDPSMMMCILNALYFKGSWVEPFMSQATNEELFIQENGTHTQVKMMHQRRHYDYMENDSVQMITLPFGNRSFTMSFILPRKEISTTALLESLDANRWNAWKNEAGMEEVDLSLPRFTSEYSIRLNEILQELGARLAFTGQADFSGISSTPLCIDQVLQKTFVKVDDTGAEAAAVTAITMKLTAMAPQEHKVMILNHPFLFTIQDEKSGAILFVGKVGAPK